MLSKVEEMFPVPEDASPNWRGFPLRICPSEKYKNNKGLNFKEDSALRGICKISPLQIISCYGHHPDSESYSANDFKYMCSNCPYSEKNNIVCNPFYSSIFDASYIDKRFSDCIDDEKRKYFVYFVTDGSYIKIGKAKEPLKRLSTLQVGNPKVLSILYLIPCKSEKAALSVEHTLHSLYYNYRECGEWFDIKDKIDRRSFTAYYNPSYYITQEEE